MQVLSEQIRSCFIKMSKVKAEKTQIFEYMVKWIKERTNVKSQEACEAIVAYFVQNCEVFNEIAE